MIIQTKPLKSYKTINTYKAGLNVFFNKTAKLILFLGIFFGITVCKIMGIKFLAAFFAGIFTGLFLNILNSKIFADGSIREIFDFRNEYSFKKLFNLGIIISCAAYGIVISLSVIFYHLFKDYQFVGGFAFGIGLVYFVVVSINAVCAKTTEMTNEFLNSHEYGNNEEKKCFLFAGDIFKLNLPAFYQISEFLTSYACVLIAAISVGMYCMELMASFLPVIISANGIFTILFVYATIRLTKTTDYIKSFIVSNIFAVIVFNIINYFTIKYRFTTCNGLVYSLITGSTAGLIVNFISIRKIFFSNKFLLNISNEASIDEKHVFAVTLKEALYTAFLPCFMVFCMIIISFLTSYGPEAPLMGVWGIILAVLGFMCSSMISVLYMNFSQSLMNLDLFSNLGENNIDFKLIKETGKKFLMVFNGYTDFFCFLVVAALLLGYSVAAELEEIDLINPYVLSSLVLGLCIPFVYLGMNVNNVLKNSKKNSF